MRVSSRISRCASEPPSRRLGPASAASSSAAWLWLAGGQPAHRPGQGSDDLAVGGVRVGRRPSRPAGRARRRSSSASSVTAECMARNGVDGPLEHVAAGQVGDLGQVRLRRARPGVSAHRNSSDPVSTSARQPRPCSGRSWASYRRRTASRSPSDSSCSAACQAKWLRLSIEAPSPVTQPSIQARPGHVVAGLVVRVRPGVGGVAGARLDGQRPAAELHRLVEAALLLAHEGQQPGEPPVVAVRRDGLLDDRPGLLGDLGHAGEGDRRHRGREQQRVAAGTPPGAPPAVASRRATWRTTACTWLRSRSVARPACRLASRSRAWTSTLAHSSWPSSASAAWPEREGRVVGDRGGQRGQRPRLAAAARRAAPASTPQPLRGWWSAHTRRGHDTA